MVVLVVLQGQWRLYSATTDKPLHSAEKTTLPFRADPGRAAVDLPIDLGVLHRRGEDRETRGFKLFVDDVQVNAGVTSDQLLRLALRRSS
jgi:hypothetical protein